MEEEEEEKAGKAYSGQGEENKWTKNLVRKTLTEDTTWKTQTQMGGRGGSLKVMNIKN